MASATDDLRTKFQEVAAKCGKFTGAAGPTANSNQHWPNMSQPLGPPTIHRGFPHAPNPSHQQHYMGAWGQQMPPYPYPTAAAAGVPSNISPTAAPTQLNPMEPPRSASSSSQVVSDVHATQIDSGSGSVGAAADLLSSRKWKYIGIAVAVLVVLLVGYFLYRRYFSRSSASSTPNAASGSPTGSITSAAARAPTGAIGRSPSAVPAVRMQQKPVPSIHESQGQPKTATLEPSNPVTLSAEEANDENFTSLTDAAAAVAAPAPVD